MRLTFNANLDFGLTVPGGGRWAYTLLGVVIALALFRLSTRVPVHARTYATSLALVIGGALGNLSERIARGTVTDFLDLGAGSFNVADVVLTSGLLLYLYIRGRDGANEEGWTWHRQHWIMPHVLPPSARVRSP